MTEDIPEEFQDIYFMLKLISGDTILCQVLEDTDKNIIIRDPFQVNIQSIVSDDGVRAITYYSEWFAGSSARTHMVRKDHVVSAAIPEQAVKDEYTLLIRKKIVKNVVKAKKQSTTAKKPDWTGLDFNLEQNDRFGPN